MDNLEATIAAGNALHNQQHTTIQPEPGFDPATGQLRPDAAAGDAIQSAESAVLTAPLRADLAGLSRPKGKITLIDEGTSDTGYKRATIREEAVEVPSAIVNELEEHVKQARRFQTQLIRVPVNGNKASDLADAILKLPKETKIGRITHVRVDPADGKLMFETQR